MYIQLHEDHILRIHQKNTHDEKYHHQTMESEDN